MTNNKGVTILSLDGITKPPGEKWVIEEIQDAAAWIPYDKSIGNGYNGHGFHMLTRSKLKVLFWLNECEMSVKSLHFKNRDMA